MNLQKIKSNYAQISIPIIGALIIISWIFLIVPDLKNDFSTYEGKVERISESAKVEKVGDPLPTPKSAKLTLEVEIINTDGNILEIQSTFQDHNIFTDEIVWESIDESPTRLCPLSWAEPDDAPKVIRPRARTILTFDLDMFIYRSSQSWHPPSQAL